MEIRGELKIQKIQKLVLGHELFGKALGIGGIRDSLVSWHFMTQLCAVPSVCASCYYYHDIVQSEIVSYA